MIREPVVSHRRCGKIPIRSKICTFNSMPVSNRSTSKTNVDPLGALTNSCTICEGKHVPISGGENLFIEILHDISIKDMHSRLFDGPRSGTPRVKGTGYGTRKKALNTIRKLRTKPRALQMQIAQTMFYRAKYHKYQTPGMRNAMRVYGPYIRTLKRSRRDPSSP
jgi:hypothetical protein